MSGQLPRGRRGGRRRGQAHAADLGQHGGLAGGDGCGGAHVLADEVGGEAGGGEVEDVEADDRHHQLARVLAAERAGVHAGLQERGGRVQVDHHLGAAGAAQVVAVAGQFAGQELGGVRVLDEVVDHQRAEPVEAPREVAGVQPGGQQQRAQLADGGVEDRVVERLLGREVVVQRRLA